MNIKILIDDHSDPECRFKTEHGFCVYAEFKGYQYLIDTGQSAVFLENARTLHVDIEDIDVVIITHGHYDHLNGLPHFLAVNKKALIIASKLALDQQFFSDRNGQIRYIGKNFYINSKEKKRFAYSEGNIQLPEGLVILNIPVKNYLLPEANSQLYKLADQIPMQIVPDRTFTKRELNLIPDDFNHEVIPCFLTYDKVVVFTGCAHQGLLNILESVANYFHPRKISHVIGGFHLIDSTDENLFETPEELDFIANRLDIDYPGTMFYTGHCTGMKSFNQLKLHIGERMNLFYPGFTRVI